MVLENNGENNHNNNDGLNGENAFENIAHSENSVNNSSQTGSGMQGSIPLMRVPIMVPNGLAERLKKFNKSNFKRWQQKMFYLTTLGLARLLIEAVPNVKEQESDVKTVSTVEAWKHSNFLCRNYVLNGLHNMQYDVSVSSR